MTSKEKTKFRTTSKWKNWRKYLIKKNNNRCSICGVEKKGKASRYLQVHHLDPDKYTLLKEDKFVVVCSQCHKDIERFLKRNDFDVDDYIDKLKSAYTRSK